MDKLGYYTLSGYGRSDTIYVDFAESVRLRLYADGANMSIEKLTEDTDETINTPFDSVIILHNTFEELRLLGRNQQVLAKVKQPTADWQARAFKRKIGLHPHNWNVIENKSVTTKPDDITVPFCQNELPLIDSFTYYLYASQWSDYFIHIKQGEEYLTEKNKPLDIAIVSGISYEMAKHLIRIENIIKSDSTWWMNSGKNLNKEIKDSVLMTIHGFIRYPVGDAHKIYSDLLKKRVTTIDDVNYVKNVIDTTTITAEELGELEKQYYFELPDSNNIAVSSYSRDGIEYTMDLPQADSAFVIHEDAALRELTIYYRKKVPEDSLVALVLENSLGELYFITFGNEHGYVKIMDNEVMYDPPFEKTYSTYRTRKIRDIASILTLHNNFNSVRSISHQLDDTWAAYKNNNLLSEPLKKYINDQSSAEIPFNLDALQQDYARFYPWQSILYGEGKLELKKTVDYDFNLQKKRTTASENLQLASQTLASKQKKSGGAINAATVAAGLSDFIVDRAQEELNITFIDRMEEAITRDFPEFKLLFPETYSTLKEFEIRQYRTLLAYSQASFQADLSNLGLHFPKLFDLPKYRNLADHPSIYDIALIYDLANKVYENTPIDSVLLHLYTRLDTRLESLEKRTLNNLSGELLAAKRKEKSSELDILTGRSERLFEQINHFDALLELGKTSIYTKFQNKDDLNKAIKKSRNELNTLIHTQYNRKSIHYKPGTVKADSIVLQNASILLTSDSSYLKPDSIILRAGHIYFDRYKDTLFIQADAILLYTPASSDMAVLDSSSARLAISNPTNADSSRLSYAVTILSPDSIQLFPDFKITYPYDSDYGKYLRARKPIGVKFGTHSVFGLNTEKPYYGAFQKNTTKIEPPFLIAANPQPLSDFFWLRRDNYRKDSLNSQLKEYELIIPTSLRAELDYDYEFKRLDMEAFDEYFKQLPSDTVLVEKGLTLLHAFLNSDQLALRQQWLASMNQATDTILQQIRTLQVRTLQVRTLQDKKRAEEYNESVVAYFHLLKKRNTIKRLLEARIKKIERKAETAKFWEGITDSLDVEGVFEKLQKTIGKTEGRKNKKEAVKKAKEELLEKIKERYNNSPNNESENPGIQVDDSDIKRRTEELEKRFADLIAKIDRSATYKKVDRKRVKIEGMVDKKFAKFEVEVLREQKKTRTKNKKRQNPTERIKVQGGELREVVTKTFDGLIRQLESENTDATYLSSEKTRLLEKLTKDFERLKAGVKERDVSSSDAEINLAFRLARERLKFTALLDKNIEKLERKIKNLDEKHERKIKNLGKKHKRKIKALGEKPERKIKALGEKHEREIKALGEKKSEPAALIKKRQEELDKYLLKRFKNIKLKAKEGKDAEDFVEMINKKQLTLEKELKSNFKSLYDQARKDDVLGREGKLLIHAAKSIEYLIKQLDDIGSLKNFDDYDRAYKERRKSEISDEDKANLKRFESEYIALFQKSAEVLKKIDADDRFDFSTGNRWYFNPPTQSKVDELLKTAGDSIAYTYPNYYSSASRLNSLRLSEIIENYRNNISKEITRVENEKKKEETLSKSDGKIIAGYDKDLEKLKDRREKYYLDWENIHDSEYIEYLIQQQPILVRTRDEYDSAIAYYEEMSGMNKKMQLWLDSIADEAAKLKERLYQLEKSYTKDAYNAKQQTQQLSTITEIAIHLLDAFRYGSLETQSITIPDTIQQHIVIKKNDTEISYDSLLIKEKVIASGRSVKKWISREQFRQIMEDTLSRAAYIGLLYQRLANIEGNEDLTPEGIAQVTTQLINTIYDLDNIRATIGYKKKLGKELAFQDYYPFIRSTVDFLNTLINTPIGNQAFSKKHKSLRDFTIISDQSLSLFENVFAESYGPAIQNLVNLFGYIWEVDVKAAQQDHSLLQSIRKRTALGESKEEDEAYIRDYEKNPSKSRERLKKALLIYGSFMAEIVAAEDANAVKSALGTAAVPPGSSSVKRTSDFNISFNSYFGGGFYRETLQTDELTDEVRRSGSIGLSVPVGFTLTKGGIGLKNWSFSAFVPILDLGVVTAYRIDADNAGISNNLPELSFSNLIAPGAYFIVNLPRSPFSLAAGVQFGPQLRKITVNGAETTASAWRYGLTGTIDVPIFNLFNR